MPHPSKRSKQETTYMTYCLPHNVLLRFLTFLRKLVCTNMLSRSTNYQITDLNSSSVTWYKTLILVYMRVFENFTYLKQFYAEKKRMVFYGVNIISQRVLYGMLFEHRDNRSYHIKFYLILSYTIPYKTLPYVTKKLFHI